MRHQPFAPLEFPSRSPQPYTLNPTPHTVHPATCTLHPSPYTLNLTPYALHPTPYTPHPTPQTLRPTPYTLRPTPTPQTQILHPKRRRGWGFRGERPVRRTARVHSMAGRAVAGILSDSARFCFKNLYQNRVDGSIACHVPVQNSHLLEMNLLEIGQVFPRPLYNHTTPDPYTPRPERQHPTPCTPNLTPQNQAGVEGPGEGGTNGDHLGRPGETSTAHSENSIR